MTSIDVQVLCSGTCYLIWQSDFADVTQLRILRWGLYPILFGGLLPDKREAEGALIGGEKTPDGGRAWTMHFEDEGRG